MIFLNFKYEHRQNLRIMALLLLLEILCKPMIVRMPPIFLLGRNLDSTALF